MSTELAFRRWFLSSLSSWSCCVEPRSGGSMGVPDTFLLPPGEAFLLPVELKRAHIEAGQLFPERIRPVQIAWHEGLRRAGGRTLFLFGVHASCGWYAYLMPALGLDQLGSWRRGYPLSMFALVAIANRLDQAALWQAIDDVIQRPKDQRDSTRGSQLDVVQEGQSGRTRKHRAATADATGQGRAADRRE